jgi:hypothetical protein
MEAVVDPYKSPSSNVNNEDVAARERALCSGRRIVNLCMFSWLAAASFNIFSTPFGSFYIILVIILTFIGGFRLLTSLPMQLGSKVLCVFGLLIPPVSIIVMFLLSQRAAKELVARKYLLGMFVSTKSGDFNSQFDTDGSTAHQSGR